MITLVQRRTPAMRYLLKRISAPAMPCYTEVRLMIVPETTFKAMEKAMIYAHERGMFDKPDWGE